MTEQTNLFPLKVIVITLGFLLIGGMIFLFVMIASKTSQIKEADCKDATLSLQGQGAITTIAPQGATVQITLANKHKTMLLTIDRCSGKILQTLTIEP